jgi:hypothetical protein
MIQQYAETALPPNSSRRSYVAKINNEGEPISDKSGSRLISRVIVKWELPDTQSPIIKALLDAEGLLNYASPHGFEPSVWTQGV